MATVLRTTTAPVLLAIQQQLIAFTGFPAERVLISKSRTPPLYQADQDLVIRLRGFGVNQACVDGGGRMDTRLIQRVSILCRSRLALDTENDDTLWFTDPAYGYLPLEDMVIDALQLFLPVDVSSNAIDVQPMRLVGGSDYEEDKKTKGWGYSTLDFEIVFAAALTQTIQ